MKNALKIIIAKSPAAMQEAIKCIQAISANSPIIQQRYNRVVDLALNDPEAKFSPDERAEIASHLETTTDETRSYTLRVRLTEIEQAELEQLADEDQQSLSEYVRSKIF